MWSTIVRAHRDGATTLEGGLKDIIAKLRAQGYLADGSVRSIRAAFRLLLDYTPIIKRPGRFAWKLQLTELRTPTDAFIAELTTIEGGSPPSSSPSADPSPPATYRVHVHETDANAGGRGARVISGFPDLGSAREYARRRVRDSLEILRKPDQTPQDLHVQWAFYGVEARVEDDDWRVDVRRWAREPAGPEERDWGTMERQLNLTTEDIDLGP